ncbi:hypothetical protein WMY93_014283 [Mugilogobius chulae]|uniref:Ig-like domain-containing protein n=1 Tax=Mugilogobius chulae TaxID=88201 RepID=A0AAW0NV51_9GOBI
MFGLVFSLCWILLNQTNALGFEVKCPAHVVADRNSDVILNCSVVPSKDLSGDYVHMTFTFLHESKKVFIWRDGKFATDQDEHFRGRTELNTKVLKDGNISVGIKNITEKDEGNYSCLVMFSGIKKQDTITLLVNSKTSVDPRNDSFLDPKSLTTGGIVGIGLSCLFLIGLAVLVVGIFICRRRRTGDTDQRNDQYEMVQDK